MAIVINTKKTLLYNLINLKINIQLSKPMTIEQNNKRDDIRIKRQRIEQIGEFKNLGTLIESSGK